MSPRRTRSTLIGSWPRRQLIALTFLLMIISATLLLTTVNEVEAKGMKKLKKLLKMKKLKKYLPLLLMGPRIIIITRDNDYGQQSYGGSGGSYGGGGSYDDGGYAVDPGYDYKSIGY